MTEPCLAVIAWTDLPDGRTLLHVADPADGRILIREIPAAERGSRIEVMALICRSTLSLLLDGGRIGVVPAPGAMPPQAPASGHPAPLPEKGSIRPPLAIGVGYAFASRSTGVPAMHGLDLLAGWNAAPGLTLRAGYTFFAPADVAGGQAEIRVRRHPISLGFDLLFGREGSRWQAGVGFGVFADVLDQETRRLRDPAAVPRANRDTLFGLSAALPLACRISEHLSVVARFGIDYFINSINYIYLNNSSDLLSSTETDPDGPAFEKIESPWRLQPRMHLGLSISLP